MMDTKPDIERAQDRGERIGLMDPLLLSDGNRRRGELLDRALDLAQKSAGLKRSLPESLVETLADLVRAMNCYYSNLIEGHDTHPIDIERALKDDFSTDQHTRDLQLEARAHIAVQDWIDTGGLTGRAVSVDGLCELHRRFCELLPDDLLWLTLSSTGERVRVVPGAFRERDVEVGRHIPISPGALPRFMQRFEDGYAGLGKSDRILAAAAAHHRLLWIHPFLDGNGRVARLMSHACLLETLDTGAIWSVARGLARNVDTYKSHLAACDSPRRGDLDGRGSLSESALADFIGFFLDVSIDQVDFMESLIQPNRLRTRIQLWAEESVRMKKLPPRAGRVLDALLYRGELPRGELPDILDTGERNARRVVAALAEQGVVRAETPRAPLRLTFPAHLAGRWMPGLFPEKTGS